MFTDMVGYSALTQKNEALALAVLEEHRTILRPFFQKHDGREIKTAGDSFLVEFNSAVESTNCAIEIQSALHERNKTETLERQILLRIGIHIGDVVYIDQDVYGDGVNIAARLEPLADPGGICISEDVARLVRNKVDFPVKKLGHGKLKNITMPMDIYCVALPWLPDGAQARKLDLKPRPLIFIIFLLVMAVAGFLFFLLFPKKPVTAVRLAPTRVAVLPLANFSNNPQDEYFADGLTEELISSLSKIRGLSVIARTSVMKYKEAPDKDVTDIGKELRVGTVLEGSVRKFRNKVRITVQLIDVATQEHLWSMDYDRELQDIFTIQSEIAQNVADELEVRLVSEEKYQLTKNSTDNMAAFQEYLIGKYFLNKKTAESIQSAVSHFKTAIEKDPGFALPYASLAYCYTLIGVAGYGNVPKEFAESEAKKAIAKALEIDESLAEAHAALGYIKFRIDWDWQGAEKEFKRAIALKPGYATAHEWYALFLAVHARLDEALREIQKAKELDPLSPSVNTGMARIYHFRNEMDLALDQINKTLELDPNYAEAYFTRGMTFYKMKNYEKAIPELEKGIQLSGRRPVIVGLLGSAYLKHGNKEKAMALLAELEKPPINNDKLYAISFIKSNMGQSAEALDIIDKLLAEKYGILIYMKVEKDFLQHNDTLRFNRMLKKMGFK
jgi:adenylate cyclase